MPVRSTILFLLGLCLLGLSDARAQPYAHIAPHTVSGAATLTSATYQTYVSVGLTATGSVESPSHVMAFGPWPIYALRRQDDTGSTIESLDVSAVFHLDQNYPNPFHPATTIRFSVAEPGRVRLTVYDPLGRMVTILVDDYRAPGTYTLPFDAADQPSGLYVYRLEAGTYHAARTMLLLK